MNVFHELSLFNGPLCVLMPQSSIKKREIKIQSCKNQQEIKITVLEKKSKKEKEKTAGGLTIEYEW
jgi:hypothetical protein